MLRAVLFDLDGTLIDSAPSIAEALNRVIDRRGGTPVDVTKVRRLVSRGAPELVATCFGACATTPARDLADFREIYAALEPDPRHLYPGAFEILRGLAAEKLQLGLCTNKLQGLTEWILEGLNLRPFFSVVLGGDAVPRPKPHPDHLLQALSILGVSKCDAVYVGDSEVDAEATAKAAIPFILARYGYPLGPLDGIFRDGEIDRLDDLPTRLSKMFSSR